jgi:hypothetical protein
VKILITGKRDKLWKAAGAALSNLPGVRATLMPVGSMVIEPLRNQSLDAVLFTLSSEEELELLRWVLKISPEIPLIAMLPAKNPKLRKMVQEEGAAQVLEVTGSDPDQIRQVITVSRLRMLGPAGTPTGVSQQISDDLHAIRDALTAILGNAELALKLSAKPASSRKRLLEIPRGVTEIEKILRRLHRIVKSKPLAVTRSR